MDQEFVVGGYKRGKNTVENLAIGYYDRERLLFIAKLAASLLNREGR